MSTGPTMPAAAADGSGAPTSHAQRLTLWCAGAACAVALTAAAGWLLNARVLAGQWGTYLPMAPSTALAVLLLGGGLFVSARWPSGALSRRAALAGAILAALLGLPALVDLITGYGSSVEWELARTNEMVGGVPLGRMSPLTAATFLLESGALLLALGATRRRVAASLAALLALLATGVSLVVLIGYLYGAPLLYGGSTIPVALPTALAVALMGAGQLNLLLPGIPVLRAWRGGTMRGTLMRAFLPAVLLIIIIEGWADDAIVGPFRFVSAAVWHALTALAASGLIVAIIGWIAHRTGDALERAQEEQSNLEARLRQAQHMETVGRLAGGVAHELNNMLGVILGHSELALGQVGPAQPIHADLTAIRNAANRSAGRVRQLLAFAGKQMVEPTLVDVNRTLSGTVARLRGLIRQSIDIDWRPAPDLWRIRMDPAQLDQILTSLCLNAAEAIPDAGRIAIETGNRTADQDVCAAHPDLVPGDYVRLAVSDTGCGMDQDTLAHIFEPFFTTKAMGTSIGMGLAAVYGAVRQNGGSITVDSAPGRGARVEIFLPRGEGNAAQAGMGAG